MVESGESTNSEIFEGRGDGVYIVSGSGKQGFLVVRGGVEEFRSGEGCNLAALLADEKLPYGGHVPGYRDTGEPVEESWGEAEEALKEVIKQFHKKVEVNLDGIAFLNERMSS